MTKREQRLLRYLDDDCTWHEDQLLKLAMQLNPELPMGDGFLAQWRIHKDRILRVKELARKISQKFEDEQLRNWNDIHYGY